MDVLLNDLRYGFRMLCKDPGFTAVAVLVLALGIGANTAIFSVVNGLLLHPLPYKDPERLVMVYRVFKIGDSVMRDASVSDHEFVEWRSQNRVFTHIAATLKYGLNLTGGDQPERIIVSAVTAQFFELLGIQPMLGRSFSEEDEKPAHNDVAILSHELWQRRFGSDPAVLGRTIQLNGKSFSVIGVMPPGFRHPDEAGFGPLTLPFQRVELWLPQTLSPANRNYLLRVIARLKPGVTREQAHAEIEVMTQRLHAENRSGGFQAKVNIIPLHEAAVGNRRLLLSILLGAVGFVLLIACANVANMMLARAAGRQTEMAVRTAVGATRMDLIRLLLAESLLLSFVAGALGVLLALWVRDILVSFAPSSMIRGRAVQIDIIVLGFTLVISLTTGVLVGLAPALHGSKVDPQQSLKEGGTRSALVRHRARSILVVCEIALAAVLFIGATLMIRSFMRLTHVNPGYNPNHVLTANVSLPESVYRTNDQIKRFYDELLERARTVPGVLAAGLVNMLPMTGGWSGDFMIEGQHDPAPILPSKPVISSNYFRALGIPLLQGRYFSEQDSEHAPPVVIITDSMARRLWPNENPIGKRIYPDHPRRGDWHTIVGVVGEVKQMKLSGEYTPAIYLPYQQVSRLLWLRDMTLVVRTNSDPLSLAAIIRREVRNVDKDQPVYGIRSLQQHVSNSIAEPRFNTLLLSGFSALALVLALVGIYGVMSYSVAQRTHEIGVRMALGAGSHDVVKLVVGEGLRLVLIGLVVGLAGAFALTRFLGSLLYGVTATDPPTFVGVLLLLTLMALLANYVPAHRATKLDPMVELRYE